MDQKEAALRYEALEECLTIVEALRRDFSRNGNGLVPKPGYEIAWDREAQNRETIQRMMRELRVQMTRGGSGD